MLEPDAEGKEVTISSTMTQQINLLKQAVRNANADDTTRRERMPAHCN